MLDLYFQAAQLTHKGLATKLIGDKMNKTAGEYVIVLGDGSTYTGWQGCSVLWVPEGIDEEDVDSYVKNASTHIQISLTSIEDTTDRFYGDLYVPPPPVVRPTFSADYLAGLAAAVKMLEEMRGDANTITDLKAMIAATI